MEMNKKSVRKIVSTILTIVIFIFFVYYFYNNQSTLESLKNISLGRILLIITVQSLIVFVYAVLNHIIIKKIQKDVPFLDNLYLQFANNFLNKVVTKGGFAFRGIYLKKVYKFPYSKFVSTLSGLYVVSFMSYSIAAFICFIIFYLRYELFNIPLVLAFVAVFIGSIILLFLPTKIFDKKEGRVFNILSSILKGWAIIKQDVKFVFLLTIVTVGVLLFNTFQMQIIYSSLGLEVSYLSVFFLSVVSLLTLFINITPDAIGIKEGIYA
jgi:uncharacterized membrane protein YbhN (UPF0104 family)